MRILSIDSAGNGCAVCVWQDGLVVSEAQEHMTRGQDQRLMPLIEETMRQSGIAYDNLDRIAVTRGPGSFTGLRIGLAAARGIGLAASKPVIGISRFDIYCATLKGCANPRLVMIDSRRTELYVVTISADGHVSEPLMWPRETIESYVAQHPDLVTTGDVGGDWAQNFYQPEQSEVALCAELAALTCPATDNNQAMPLYVRPPDVTVKKQPAA